MIHVFIARHGQDEDNARNLLNGHRDTALTELGISQAHTLAENIAASGVAFDRVYSSPLIRAYATAKVITDRLRLSGPTILRDLIERDFGMMTGRPRSDIETVCAPDIIKTDNVTYFLSPAGAETFPRLFERAQRVLSWLHTHHSDGTFLLVCHGDIGKMLYAANFRIDWADALSMFDFDNAQLIPLDRAR